MNGTPGMYVHVYQCGECKAYGTQECVWKNTKENNIACEKFEYKVPTSSNGSIDIAYSTTINNDEI